MTNPIRHRSSTALMTQALRPDCEVISKFEVHPYFGPGKVMESAPCMMAGVGVWWSEGTAWDQGPETTRKSPTVIAAHDALLQQHTKATKRRHHLTQAAGFSLTALPGFPATCGEDSGAARTSPFEGSDNGKSSAIFGPRDVLAAVEGTQPVAVIRYNAGTNAGWCNFTVCSLLVDLPIVWSTQTPSTVFLGMTKGDTAAAWISTIGTIVTDLLLSYVLGKVAGALVKLAGPLIGRLSQLAVDRWFSPAVAAWLRGTLTSVGEVGLKSGLTSGFRSLIRLAHGGSDLSTEFSDRNDDIADIWDACAEAR